MSNILSVLGVNPIQKIQKNQLSSYHPKNNVLGKNQWIYRDKYTSKEFCGWIKESNERCQFILYIFDDIAGNSMNFQRAIHNRRIEDFLEVREKINDFLACNPDWRRLSRNRINTNLKLLP